MRLYSCIQLSFGFCFAKTVVNKINFVIKFTVSFCFIILTTRATIIAKLNTVDENTTADNMLQTRKAIVYKIEILVLDKFDLIRLYLNRSLNNEL